MTMTGTLWKAGNVALALASLAFSLAPRQVLAEGAVKIVSEAGFRDPLLIAKAVIDECDLPKKQIESVLLEAKEAGIDVRVDDAAVSYSPGRVLLVEIVRADSMRSGSKHVKLVAVAGKLFEDGEQIGSFVAQRRSSGGYWGQFMTSCAVLERCTDRIARDIVPWLKSPRENAQLGEGRHRLDIQP